MMQSFKTLPREQASRRRKWTEEEDQTLIELVARFGLDNWRVVGQQMGQRDAKQCRERYLNHLDPTVKKGKLTLREWKTLIEAHDRFGNKWSDIAALIPGRTPNTLKNFWHSNLRALAIKELFGTEAYSQGSRTSRFNANDRELEQEFMADEVPAPFGRPPSPDRMDVEDEESSVSSVSLAAHTSPSVPYALPAAIPAFPNSLPIFSAPHSQSASASYLPSPMLVEEKKPFASTTSSLPLPHIWDALVETAMAEYQREQVPRPGSYSFAQPSLFMSPQSPYMSMPMAPMTPQPSQPSFPAMGFGMGFGPSAPNAFDSGKGFQFWSH